MGFKMSVSVDSLFYPQIHYTCCSFHQEELPILLCPANFYSSFQSVLFSLSVMSDSLRAHESQHTRPKYLFPQGYHFFKANYIKCPFSYSISICCCCLVAKSSPTLLQPHGLQPTRLLCAWNFPGKNTRVGFHFLLHQ